MGPLSSIYAQLMAQQQEPTFDMDRLPDNPVFAHDTGMADTQAYAAARGNRPAPQGAQIAELMKLLGGK